MIEETVTDKILEIFSSHFPREIFSEYLEMFRKEMNKRYKKILSSLSSQYDIPMSTLYDEKNDEEIKFEDLLNQLPRFSLNYNLPCFPTLIFNVFINYLIEYSHLIIPSLGFEELVSKWETIMGPEFQQLKFSLPPEMFDAFAPFWKNIKKKVVGSGQETKKMKEKEFTNAICSLFKETDTTKFISRNK